MLFPISFFSYKYEFEIREGRGLWIFSPPPGPCEIYVFQGVFRPQRMVSPRGRKKIESPLPPVQTPEYAPGVSLFSIC